MLERKAQNKTEQTKISHHLKLRFPLFVFAHPSTPLDDSLAPQGRTQESLNALQYGGFVPHE